MSTNFVQSKGQITPAVFGPDSVVVGYRPPGQQKIYPLLGGTPFPPGNVIAITGDAICGMLNKTDRVARILILEEGTRCPHTLYRDEPAYIGFTASDGDRVQPLSDHIFPNPPLDAILLRMKGASVCALINQNLPPRS